MQYSAQSIEQKKNLSSSVSEPIYILMVDDLQENLLALEAVLNSPRYHLVFAKSGEEALKCILKYDFAVILLDVQMPGLNGFETAKLIKERKKSRHIPIIFITAISQDIQHITQGYQVGAIDYIVKPFNPETLRSKVAQFVQIYESHTKSLHEINWQTTSELEKMNKELRITKMDLTKNTVFSSVLQKALQDTIVTFDEDGTIISVNPSVRNMFGYEEDDLIGSSIEVLLHSVESEVSGETPITFDILMPNFIGRMIEAKAKRKNNIIFPVDLYIGDAMVEDYQLFVCTIRDISERKEVELLRKQQVDQLEHAVEERTLELLSMNHQLHREREEKSRVTDDLMLSEGRFQQIFEASPCMMAIRSLQNPVFIAVNKNWVASTGYTMEELKEDSYQWEISKDINGLEEKFHEDEWQTPFKNQRVFFMLKNGEQKQGLLSTEIITIENKNCVLIVLNDITERLAFEKEMARLDQLNLVGEMAAGIAHEIRNPMTTVHGFLQIGKSNPSNLSLEHMELMIDELDRANKIIKEFLTLAKNKTSDKRKYSLNKIIEIIYPLINAEALLTGKKVNLQLDDCPELYLDEKEIRQLLLNLALNGLEAMDAEGILTIRTFCQEQYLVLEIIDSGTGIDEEILNKLGTPFFTTKDNGTGLGLAVCYRIAERHKARIKVKTSENGTRFSVYFEIVEGK
ncbi:response regulator [Cytobacillus oceanisediminis]|uniref:response regulator n=1 Tax=Bacillaceae TaxID=186817 RepID=UPI000332959E|nr:MULTISPECIES: response regulator [Bacillaceae]EOR25986.1 multi-sensor signal transduction histidine kinase [Niallia nealsonii AAU1]MDU1847110.1 response regulator [Niallia nealsonii]MBZ9533710.1 response regulator [Cytobacillus oceanisediminis]MED3795108.1 response regulator [Niallia alba]UTI43586.1 response regulator [Niallia sp. RD1]